MLSPILESDLLFNYVGLSWSSSNPDGSSLAFWVRTSPDGRSWSPWQTVQVEMPPGPLAEYDTYGALIWADRANYVQFLGELRGAGKEPAVDRVGLTLLNPYDGPILETGADLSDGGFVNTALAAEADSYLEAGAAPVAAIGKPTTFRREDWGADESLRFSGGQEIWPREYVSTRKLVVHHTVTGNSYSTVEDAKATVRAIYAYHASSLGWGDIGYNSLVDKFGNSYEGRRGRDGPGYDGPGGREILSENVVGGHASSYNHGSSGIALLGTFCTTGECSGGGSPTAAMLSRLKDVLTWKSQQHGIDPQGNSDFLRYNGTWHRDLPNIVGHRDVASTTCPGGNVYALLPQLRSDVAARLGSDGVLLSDGALLRGSGPTVYVMRGGLKRAIPNPATFEAEGYLWGNINVIADTTLGSIPKGQPLLDALADGSPLKGSDATVYVMEGGVRRAISLAVFRGCGYGFDAVREVSDGVLGMIPAGPVLTGSSCPRFSPGDGSLLKGRGATVYVMRGGLKRATPNPATFEAEGYLWGNINVIADSALGSIPEGQPLLDALADGSLLKGSGATVYVMEGGLRRAIPLAVFQGCGYGFDAVRTISDGLLGAIPTGSLLSMPSCPRPSFADGTLLKGTGGTVYVMQGGAKRGITGAGVLVGCGYQWGNINVLADSTLNSIPSGAPLSGSPCPASAVEGSLMRGSDPTVYVIRGGLKRPITNPVTFEAAGFRWDDVVQVPEGWLANFPTGQPLLDALADGSLLKGSGATVYVMEGGLRRAIPLAVFQGCGYGFDAVRTISDGLLGAIPTGSLLSMPSCPRPSFADGTLLKGTGGTVYVMQGGAKRGITGAGVLVGCGYQWGNINVLADSTLNSIPSGPPLSGSPCP